LHFNSQAAVFRAERQGNAPASELSGRGKHRKPVRRRRRPVCDRLRRQDTACGNSARQGDYIDTAKEKLNGVTLESLVVAERVARAVIKSAKKGVLNLADFPLLMHVNEILTEKKAVNIPWEKFTYIK
jgi:glycerol-3-phosphate dehydrogenase (NAD(P)+)